MGIPEGRLGSLRQDLDPDQPADPRARTDRGCSSDFGSRRLEAGDSLLVLGTPEQLETAIRLLQPASQDALGSWDGQGGRIPDVSITWAPKDGNPPSRGPSPAPSRGEEAP